MNAAPALALAMLGTESLAHPPGAARHDRAASVGEWLRAAAGLARANGLTGLQILGTPQGLRARELDRSARRDLAAILKRHGLASSGIDLPIPPAHFADPAHADRALAALNDAMGLAADLATLTDSRWAPVVAAWLPRPLTSELSLAISAHAERCGCALADLTWPLASSPSDPPPTADAHLLGIGIDPASVLLATGDPGASVLQKAPMIRQTRLSDARGGMRVPVGRGTLDVLAFRVAIELTANSRPHAATVADVSGLDDPAAALAAAASAWSA